MKCTAAVLALALAVTCASCTTSPEPAPEPISSPTPSTFTVSGTLSVPGMNRGDGNGCTTSGGYLDIEMGAQVTLTDEKGHLVALGTLAQGVEKEPDTYPGTCVFTLSVAEVPKGSPFYGVEVTHRGPVRYSAQDIRKPITLTLT